MSNKEKNELYFKWLCKVISPRERDATKLTRYSKLIRRLNEIPFNYSIPMDSNREGAGFDLRYRFGYENNIPNSEIACTIDDKPCSVLEMMIALAVSEEEITHSEDTDNYTASRWFWDMVVSLGLIFQTDDSYSKIAVNNTIRIFLNRRYLPNGRGGLFTLKNPPEDLRKVEIWYQACWYLDEVVA